MKIREELIKRVDAEGLCAGLGEEFAGREKRVGVGLYGFGADVAVAVGGFNCFAVSVEADVVYGPAIYGDGGDAFRSRCGCFAKAFFDAGEDLVERPTEFSVGAGFGTEDGAVGHSVDQLDVRLAVVPAEQRDAAAFRAEVDGYHCLGCRLGHFVQGLGEIPQGLKPGLWVGSYIRAEACTLQI